MDITLEMVDQVRERTGASYEEAKAALDNANGDVVNAIIEIERNDRAGAGVSGIIDAVKAAVQKGNVNRIRIMRDEKELVNIPVNAGVAGGVLGLMAGPWAIIPAAIAGAVARFGFDCRFQIVKEDGTVDEIGKSE